MAQESTSPTKPPDKHVCRTEGGKSLLLADDGKAHAELVVAANASPVIKFAAKELKTFLDEACGADFKVVTERTGTGPAILLGDSPAARSLGVKVDRLPRDAFVIRRVGEVVVIAGRDDPSANPPQLLPAGPLENGFERATLFGVYDFLERFVGMRSYFPGRLGTVVPKLNALRLASVDIYEEPDFTERNVSWCDNPWFEEIPRGEFLSNCNLLMYRLRGQTRLLPCCHGLSRLGLAPRFAKEHPEYFARLENGKRDTDLSLPGNHGHLCFSQPGLEDEIYQDAEAFLTGKPATARAVGRDIAGKWTVMWDPNCFQPGYFNIMPPDNHELAKCQCPKCKPIYDAGRAHELVWGFVSRIAERLRAKNIPGFVTSGAYMIDGPVPPCEIPDNVLVMVAVIGPWKENAPEMQRVDDQLIHDWVAKLKNRKVWLWNYAVESCNGIPEGAIPLSPRGIASYYARSAPYITGAFLESEGTSILLNYLNWYVFSKVAWNNRTDVRTLLKEHHRGMFGPAAKPMGQFFDLLEQCWQKRLGPAAFRGDVLEGPVMNLPLERDLWERIYPDKTMAKLDRLCEDAVKRAGDDSLVRARIQLFREKLFVPLRDKREEYLQRKTKLEHLVLEVPRAPATPKIAMDGVLNEEAWQSVRAEPMALLGSGSAARVKTTFRARWTEECLYLAFDCEEPRAANLRTDATQRNAPDIWKDSDVEIFLNPSGDRANYYHFTVNAKGVCAGALYHKNGAPPVESGWDGSLRAATQVGADRWTAEVAIPLKKVFPEGAREGVECVANFCRARNLQGVPAEENELYSWSPLPNRGFHQLDWFGRIRFVAAPPARPAGETP